MTMNNYTLLKANSFIEENKDKVVQDYRLNYHFAAPTGWINDPNGFVFYKGEYHLFYQFHPYNSEWGPMHWGHAKSKDLITWEHLPVALAPDTPADAGGCFSGSAIEKDGNLYLMYTGIMPLETENKTQQVQCIAVSKDGINFEKLKQNPIIDTSSLPINAVQEDFRDPKVFKRNGIYYSVIVSKTKQETGQVLLYKSLDLINWEFKSILLEGQEEHGVMWECPDLFELNGHDVLILSPIQMPKNGHNFHNTSSSIVMVGKVDWDTGQFVKSTLQEIDHGLDFYAPQTLQDANGNRIMIAWMQMWGRTQPTQVEKHGWAGAMTLPRVLEIKNERLIQKAVNEINHYQTVEKEYHDIYLENEIKTFDSFAESSVRIQLQADLVSAKTFYIELPKNEDEKVVLLFQVEEGVLELSREHMGSPILGSEDSTLVKRTVSIPLMDNQLQLDVFLDKSSIEVFINGGREVMTMTIFPLKEVHDYAIGVVGKATINALQQSSILVGG